MRSALATSCKKNFPSWVMWWQRPLNMELLELASAAPGADILVHEVCAELGLPRVLCLPMKVDQVAALYFGAGLDGWRNRLLALGQMHAGKARVLQDGPELPRWLDERKTDTRSGGTVHLVRLARGTGLFELHLMDCRSLLS